MDSALLKDYKSFKKRSLAQPAVEAKRSDSSGGADQVAPKRKRQKRNQELPHQLMQQAKKQAASQSFDYKTAQIRTKGRFSILSSIVDLLKKRHQNKQFEALTLAELLDLTKNTDIRPHDREWLERESLVGNPKVNRTPDFRYLFKPRYALRDRKSLVKLLERHEREGLGGVLLDDAREGLPNADDLVKSVSDRITFVTRTNDKKAILFAYESSYSVHVDEEFQKHWRSVAVEGLGEPDIEKYLSKSGITSMQGVGPAQKRPEKAPRKGRRRKNLKLQNTHLGGGLLKDYSEVE